MLPTAIPTLPMYRGNPTPFYVHFVPDLDQPTVTARATNETNTPLAPELQPEVTVIDRLAIIEFSAEQTQSAPSYVRLVVALDGVDTFGARMEPTTSMSAAPTGYVLTPKGIDIRVQAYGNDVVAIADLSVKQTTDLVAAALQAKKDASDEKTAAETAAGTATAKVAEMVQLISQVEQQKTDINTAAGLATGAAETAGQYSVTAQGAAGTATAKATQTAQDAVATAQDKIQTSNSLEQAKTLLNNALALANPQGDYNASTNLPALAAIPVAGVNGTYYDITEAGTAAFSGSNFTEVTVLAVGGKLIKKNSTTWYYQPPINLALANLNSVKVKDNGDTPGLTIPDSQYLHTRGEVEMGGNASYSGVNQLGHCMYEQMEYPVLFNQIRAFIRVLTAGDVTVRAYKSATLQTNPSSMTLLSEVVIPSGTFNTVDGNSQLIDFPVFARVKAGEFLYLMFHTSSGNRLAAKYWTVDAAAPARHSFLLTAESATPWTVAWTASSSSHKAVPFEVCYLNKNIRDIFAKLAKLVVTNGRLSGVYIPEVQYEHSRGESEMVGATNFSAAGYYGLGIARQMTTAIVFNKIEMPFFAKQNMGSVTIRVYKGAAFNSAPASMTLIHSQDILSSDFNRISNGTKLQTIQLPTPALVNANEYIHIYTFTEVDNNIGIRTWDVVSSDPERPRFKLKQTAVGWDAAWGNSSLTRYATDFRLSLVASSNAVVTTSSSPRLILPSKIYAVVGTELTIYSDAIIFGKDNGLTGNPDYTVTYSCTRTSGGNTVNVGAIKSRYWRITPVVAEVGTHTFTVVVYDKNRAEVTRKSVSLVIIPATFPATQKYYLQCGDSITADGNSRIAIGERMATLSGGISPISVGSFGAGAYGKHEGHGGWKWVDFATDGLSADIPPYGNPFWNSSTGQLDFANYRSNIGLANNFDVISLQLGVNDMRTMSILSDTQILAVINNAKTLINALLADSPAAKIIVQLPTTKRNTPYLGTNETFMANIWRLRELVLTNFDYGAYHAQVYVGQVGICVDRYFAYKLQTEVAGSRFTETEVNFTDDVHMRAEGYKQMGDALFPILLGLML